MSTTPVPALLSHCQKIYAAMHAQSFEDSEGVIHWQGHLTKLFEELGFGVPRYTRITSMMREMGCIVQIQKGSAGYPGDWILVSPPTLDLYESVKERQHQAKISKEQQEAEAHADDVTQRINDINNRLIRAESLMNAILEIHYPELVDKEE